MEKNWAQTMSIVIWALGDFFFFSFFFVNN
jgi:hypothetical protein